VAALPSHSWQNRRANLAHRRDPITGVSEFAMLTERPLSRPALPECAAGGLPVHRYAEPFEALRDRSDALLAERGARPVVFLAGLGTAAQHAGRLGFARNLMEVGGIEAVLGTGNPDELAKAFAASGATVACLCSADKVYAELAAPAAAALKAAGARQVWIAGRSELATGDIDEAIFVGCDALARLQSLYELAEVPA
jgi:methylmalonyl-CoA mutase